jgi:serralysin
MSYVEHPSESGEPLSTQAYSLTPMVWDIQAMQELYGANTTTRATDTVYFGDGSGTHGAAEYQYATNADNDLGMQVKGEDGTYRDVYLTIWDAGGQDLIDASDLSTRSLIDLRPGKYSTIGEETDNIAVAAAVRQDGAVINFIEDAWGGSAKDRIIGNNADNDLRGGGARDVIRGGRGSDEIAGEGGNDRLFGNGGADLMLGGRGKDKMNGGGGGDDLFGDAGRDTLKGRNGSDLLDGGGGNDLLIGGGGGDTFVFSDGDDRVRDFDTSRSGEVIDLSGVAAFTGFSDVMTNHASDEAEGVMIRDLTGNSMLLEGLTMSELSADDFMF